MKSARCPYCGKKVSYFKIFSEKTKGEHTCKECGRNSTIYFIRAYKFTVMITVVLAIILALVILFSTFVDDIWGVLLVFIPFAVLYLITPLFCKLVPIKKRKKRPKSEEAPTIYNPKNNNGSTRIMPFVGAEQDNNSNENSGKTIVMPVIKNKDEFTDISNIKF